jgi:tricarballylate dehydrogenase
MSEYVDVLVVGGGNAGLCAALSARDAGATVRVVDAAPFDLRGGNSAFATGTFRLAYSGPANIRHLVPSISDEEASHVDFGAYPAEQYYDDLCKLSNYRADADLALQLATSSDKAALWLRDHGVRFLPMYARQAFEVDGRMRFWGGVAVEAVGGGSGIVEALSKTAADRQIATSYGSRLDTLTEADGRVIGATIKDDDGAKAEVRAGSVILACGGFEANPAWRAQYLGPDWDLARIRGARFNTGVGLAAAFRVGAAPVGHWSDGHAVALDANAPSYGDLRLGVDFSRHSYPLGIVVNQKGERFIDEGANFRNYTYGIYGRQILAQPEHTAWQVFDAAVEPLLRPEYRDRHATRVTATSIEDLAVKMDGVSVHNLRRTIEDFNRGATSSARFDPAKLDGRCTTGLTIPKSNWASPLTAPPFVAYPVTCGLSYNYGGIRTDLTGAVLDDRGRHIAGLYAAGGIVGGLFYGNSASGSSLAFGAVQGIKAGQAAAAGAVNGF